MIPMSITNCIVGITCLVFLVFLRNKQAKSSLVFHPFSVAQKGQWYRFFSSGLVHAGVFHLGVNMLVLWSFGQSVETRYYPYFMESFSSIKYILLFFGGIAVASIPNYFVHRNNPNYAALGASGGVAAVVFANIVFAPWDNLYLFGAVAVPQIFAGAAYLIYSLIKAACSKDNVGHMAHFTGALWGVGFTFALNYELFGRFIFLLTDPFI